MATFSKKHYQQIAKVLATERMAARENAMPILNILVQRFANLFSDDNSAFDRERFISLAEPDRTK